MSDRLPDDIAEGLARCAPRLGAFAGRVSWHEQVGSTNDMALALAASGAGEGHVIAAGMQRNGRGRRGRSWSSPAGAGIYVSVLIRPSVRALPLLTLAAGVAVADGVRAAAGLAVVVKWPNDVCIEAPDGRLRKLAGILAEAGVSGHNEPYVVVGVGINVGDAPYPPDVAARATSIELELGRAVDRGLVLGECLAELWRRYQELELGRASSVLDAWRLRAGRMFGRAVEWDGEHGVSRGIAVAVDDGGALLVRAAGGERRVMSGEVRWV